MKGSRGKKPDAIPLEHNFASKAEFVSAWNAYADEHNATTEYMLDSSLKELMFRDLFDISPLDPSRVAELDSDVVWQMIVQIQCNLVERHICLSTTGSLFNSLMSKTILAPAIVIALLAKTTGRYAALEWLCQLAGCRLVVPTTPGQEGAER